MLGELHYVRKHTHHFKCVFFIVSKEMELQSKDPTT